MFTLKINQTMITIQYTDITIVAITKNGNVMINYNNSVYLCNKKLFNKLLTIGKAEIIISSIKINDYNVPCFKHVQF